MKLIKGFNNKYLCSSRRRRIISTLKWIPFLFLKMFLRCAEKRKRGMWQDQRTIFLIVNLSAFLQCEQLYTSCKCFWICVRRLTTLKWREQREKKRRVTTKEKRKFLFEFFLTTPGFEPLTSSPKTVLNRSLSHLATKKKARKKCPLTTL